MQGLCRRGRESDEEDRRTEGKRFVKGPDNNERPGLVEGLEGCVFRSIVKINKRHCIFTRILSSRRLVAIVLFSSLRRAVGFIDFSFACASNLRFFRVPNSVFHRRGACSSGYFHHRFSSLARDCPQSRVPRRVRTRNKFRRAPIIVAIERVRATIPSLAKSWKRASHDVRSFLSFFFFFFLSFRSLVAGFPWPEGQREGKVRFNSPHSLRNYNQRNGRFCRLASPRLPTWVHVFFSPHDRIIALIADLWLYTSLVDYDCGWKLKLSIERRRNLFVCFESRSYHHWFCLRMTRIEIDLVGHPSLGTLIVRLPCV